MSADRSESIQNATVELGSFGAVLTSANGGFRFENLEAGEYALLVTAFGYAPFDEILAVAGDTTLTISLEVDAFQLDSLVVEARLIDIDGVAQDPELDLRVSGADIYTSQVVEARTNTIGRFSLKDVAEGVPLTVGVRAFGYFPLDTVLVPVEDEDYVLDLQTDPLTARMVDVQIQRLVNRAGGRLSFVMRPIARERLLRWRGSLLDVIESEYMLRTRRIRCIVLDEKQLQPEIAGDVIRGMLAHEVERVEALFDGAMLRVYTRDFMRIMIAEQIELRRPTFVHFPPAPPFCT